ncbi:hypothetical protein ACH5RR_015816 [Cinchona calisaya]|uniref:Protein argonaute 2-like n=1 Tax=Cinchona calisaya TaxID=153742 RepID=A0ABD2ZWW6_9GENT
MEGKGGYNKNYGRGSGGSAGPGRGRGRGRGRDQQDQNFPGGRYHHDGGGRGGGRGRGGPGMGGSDYRPPVPGGGGVGPTGAGVWSGRPWGPSTTSGSTQSSTGQQHPMYQPRTPPPPGRPWGPSPPSTSSSSSSTGGSRPAQPQQQYAKKTTERPPHQSTSPDPVQLNFGSLMISDLKSTSSGEKSENKMVPIRRPDIGSLAVRKVSLLANHFRVEFNPKATIMHYDVDVKPVMPNGNQSLRRSITKADMHSIREKLFADKSLKFPVDMATYDGEKNIFSFVPLPTGEFQVKLSDGDDGRVRTYIFTIKEVNQLKFSKLKDYMLGNLPHMPRDILQPMELVMKDNPSKLRIPVGRSFYAHDYRDRDDLGHGIAAYRGFHQSLKPTWQGLVLCLDYSVLAFRKPLPVLDFLRECFEEIRRVDDIMGMTREVTNVLRGLKVRVTHRHTKQKYTISGLTAKSTRQVAFDLVDPDAHSPPRKISIVDYFREKYDKQITLLNIPCLDLGKPNKTNYVPMEYCVLVEGQRYPKEYLEKYEKEAAVLLKKISLASPAERRSTICDMVRADDGPCGNVVKNFEMEVEKDMTTVEGRVLGAPELKLGASNGKVCPVKVDQEKCQWNLVGKSVVEGKRLERWALIDFTSYSRSKLRGDEFINKLMQRSWKLGMHMEHPLVCHVTGMNEFSSVVRIDGLLRKVIAEARCKSGLQGMQLQLIVCVMGDKDPGYKYLKWVSETQIGVVTQCCLSYLANKGQDQYLANLCLKINAKLGGSNVELNERLPHFVDEDYVMFIGADVNHPAAQNYTCPSIAAVVGTINWPAANRYAARIQPQEHRKEKIVNFGAICRDLVNNYAQHNKVRPKKIIVFRDGVSEGQFDMVLNEELLDLKLAIYDDHYQPTITLVVAQKRHQTRLFVDGRRDRGASGNVPPGTVVDTTIVHPFEFDFYLCSHHGSLGTSKPTHYYVLWDENAFTSDRLQKLIYNMCFTYARCTKPVSLVPPVYYADLVAYRGRLFQEVVMEQSPASSASSSSAISSTSLLSSAASLDQNLYTAHPELKNVMYFV